MMKCLFLIFCVILFGVFMVKDVLVLDFKLVGVLFVIMYDVLFEKGCCVYVVLCGMLVEVVLIYGDWSKVRDVVGMLFWIFFKVLMFKCMLVVLVVNVCIFNVVDESSLVVFMVDKLVLLEMLESFNNGWVKVCYCDG